MAEGGRRGVGSRQVGGNGREQGERRVGRGRGRRVTAAAKRPSCPRRKRRTRREHGRASWRGERSRMTGCPRSCARASPVLMTQSVATARASQSRSARSGFVIRVRCHGQPPRLSTLKPCSIQVRTPYQDTVQAEGARSVRMSHGSLSPGFQHATRVQSRRREAAWNAVPRPLQLHPCCGTRERSGTARLRPSGQKAPPVLMRKNGRHPRRTMRRKSRARVESTIGEHHNGAPPRNDGAHSA